MTAKVSFKEPNLLSSASSAAHVSLSSHLQLSNNRRHPKPSQNQRPQLPPRATNQHQPIRLISLERETSSPAAPPPSSVSGLIILTHRNSQQAFFKKIIFLVSCCFITRFYRGHWNSSISRILITLESLKNMTVCRFCCGRCDFDRPCPDIITFCWSEETRTIHAGMRT